MNFRLLNGVERPARYLGGEFGSRVPKPEARVRFCLVFPDIYEIGISYYGFQILYWILNRQAGVSCERAYLPWPDMQEALVRSRTPLFSLERGRPLRDFDVVGITLQTELHYAGVVKVLDLAGIPRRWAQRQGSDPLIVGGGPNAMHCEPIAPFFDAVLLGDGEEAVAEIASLCASRQFKGAPRAERWEALAEIEGMFVPPVHSAPDGAGRRRRIRRRTLIHLDDANYPPLPVVPTVNAIHDRLVVEVMRGCTQGCRFCQAGMIHRPVRERSVSSVVQQVESGLKVTGWNEVSLLSLSASDYSRLDQLSHQLMEVLRPFRATLAFPSLRPASFSESLASLDTGGRRGQVTFAVEAGSQRLRDAINKPLTEDELFAAVDRALRHGWRGVKLYFMIGLPTETREDIAEGAHMLNTVWRMVRRRGGMSVSVSPFIPKPHSVFERAAVMSAEELELRRELLFSRVGDNRVKWSWRAPFESALETVLARGDSGLSRAVERAAETGAGLDGWGRHFSPAEWTQALDSVAPGWRRWLEAISSAEITEWRHLSSGVSEKFKRAERDASQTGRRTPDCRVEPCICCGLTVVCDRVKAAETTGAPILIGEPAPRSPAGEFTRWRLTYGKLGRARYLGHQDITRALRLGLRRTGWTLKLTGDYSPRLKLSYSQALPLGEGAVNCWVEFETADDLSPAGAKAHLAKMMPRGLKPLRLGKAVREKPLTSVKGAWEWRFRYNVAMELDEASVWKVLSKWSPTGVEWRWDSGRRTCTVTLQSSNGISAFRGSEIAKAIADAEIHSARAEARLLSITRIRG